VERLQGSWHLPSLVSCLLSAAKRPGFTLIELLVVIAAIMILGAILLPLFAQVRARARQSLCAAHLRQIAQAGLIYLADYDERFPSVFRHPSRRYAFDLPILLQPYVRDWEVQYCPERRTIRPDCLDPAGTSGSPTRCMGYGYNWGSGIGGLGSSGKRDGLVLAGPEVGQAVGVTLAEVARPAHCLFLGDTNDHDLLTLWREAMPGVRTGAGVPGETVAAFVDPYERPRHRQGNNFAFVDGHVQWLRFPGGAWIDGGPWTVPDMSMYSRTGRWEPTRLPEVTERTKKWSGGRWRGLPESCKRRRSKAWSPKSTRYEVPPPPRAHPSRARDRLPAVRGAAR
jgi:prepilin-type processing-associated H-X9-DG protein/prepilin-type N-terminal cleavage/methylation domain-containing protein